MKSSKLFHFLFSSRGLVYCFIVRAKLHDVCTSVRSVNWSAHVSAEHPIKSPVVFMSVLGVLSITEMMTPHCKWHLLKGAFPLTNHTHSLTQRLCPSCCHQVNEDNISNINMGQVSINEKYLLPHKYLLPTNYSTIFWCLNATMP